MTDDNTPHPDNAPGAFYVVGGCCTACGVPLDAAPSLFSYDGDSHCYVKRQPRTAAETEAALQAVSRAELNCIRYRGTDNAILERFAGLDHLQLCDAPEARALRPVLRNHVTFNSIDHEIAAWRNRDLAHLFAEHLRSLVRPASYRYRVTEASDEGPDCLLRVAWYEDNFHLVGFRRVDPQLGRWLV